MIYVGIDVAKDKHDCFITNSDSEILFNVFTIPNNHEGFNTLFQRIESVSDDFTNVKVFKLFSRKYLQNTRNSEQKKRAIRPIPPMLTS